MSQEGVPLLDDHLTESGELGGHLGQELFQQVLPFELLHIFFTADKTTRKSVSDADKTTREIVSEKS